MQFVKVVALLGVASAQLPGRISPDDRVFCPNGLYAKGINKGDRRPDPQSDKLSILHINAEFLMGTGFRERHCVSASSSDIIACKKWANEGEMQKHIENIASIIDRYDPDIVNVCEVFDCAAMDELRSNLKRGGQYAIFLDRQYDTATYQSCALLTKVDPTADKSGEPHVDAFGRSANEKATAPLPGSSCPSIPSKTTTLSKGYKAQFDIKGVPLSLFGVHLLAMPDRTDRCAIREAQAAIVARSVKAEIDAGREVIVTGDMNDYDTFRPPRAKENVPVGPHAMPITDAVKILREGAAHESAYPSSLKNVALLVEEVANRATSGYARGRKKLATTIDHMLVSEDIWRGTEFATVGLAHNPFVDDRCGDHFPVLIDVDLSDVREAMAAPKSKKNVGFMKSRVERNGLNEQTAREIFPKPSNADEDPFFATLPGCSGQAKGLYRPTSGPYSQAEWNKRRANRQRKAFEEAAEVFGAGALPEGAVVFSDPLYDQMTLEAEVDNATEVELVQAAMPTVQAEEINRF